MRNGKIARSSSPSNTFVNRASYMQGNMVYMFFLSVFFYMRVCFKFGSCLPLFILTFFFFLPGVIAHFFSDVGVLCFVSRSFSLSPPLHGDVFTPGCVSEQVHRSTHVLEPTCISFFHFQVEFFCFFFLFVEEPYIFFFCSAFNISFCVLLFLSQINSSQTWAELQERVVVL